MKSEPSYKEPKSEKKDEKSTKEVKDDFKREQEAVSIRKIKNGFIVSKSWQEGKGNSRQYCNEEIYYEKNPLDGE